MSRKKDEPGIDVRTALKPKLVAVASMTPHPMNPRTHPEAQVDGLGGAFEEFGMLQLPVVDERGMILAGEGRWLAARKRGVERLPVIEVRGWSDEKKLAFMLSDNRWAMLGGFDEVKLQAAVRDLVAAEYDLVPVGYNLLEVNEILAMQTEGQTDPEETPAPSKKPIVRSGDLWELGGHRILCGDCTKQNDVDKLFMIGEPHLCVTDPPYGVDYDPTWRADANKWKGSVVKFGAKAMGIVANDTVSNWRGAWELAHCVDVIYAWSSSLYADDAWLGLQENGFQRRAQIIWNKLRIVIGRGDYHWQHEPCWYAVRKGRKSHWTGSRTQSTVWDIPKPQRSESGHSTQKPVECMKRPIENNSRKGQYVYDPFVGSGTTIVACEMTGRRCLAIEIEPSYVQVAIERWQNFTGKAATMNGQTFEQILKQRRTKRTKNAQSDTRKPIRRRPEQVVAGDHSAMVE